MRARMALKVSGTSVELREVLLKEKPEEMLTASPKATVPVLVLRNGEVIDESLSVMKWALERSDPNGWLDADDEKTKSLIDENDGPFKQHLDRYKYATRYADADPQNDRAYGAEYLLKLNDYLKGSKALFGENDTLADIAIFPFVRQFRIADEAWFDGQDWNDLRQWLFRLMDAPLFQSVMEKYPVWQTGEQGISF